MLRVGERERELPTVNGIQTKKKFEISFADTTTTTTIEDKHQSIDASLHVLYVRRY